MKKNLLETNINNTHKTWKIIKSVLGKHNDINSNTQIKCDNKVIYNKKKIVNTFND